MQIKLNENQPNDKLEIDNLNVKKESYEYISVQEKEYEEKILKNKNNKKIINPNPLTNEDYFENYNKRSANNKIKKIAVYSSIIGLLVIIIFSNIYFVFIRDQISIPEIAAQVKIINKINTYPIEAIDGYLQANALELISGITEISSGSGVKTFALSDIRINKVAIKSDNNANIYFSCIINTNIGSSNHNFLIPLYYDQEKYSFAPSGSLIMCATQIENTTKEIEASLWDFGKIKQFDSNKTTEVSNFINNFLEILYNNPGNDLSTFYTGNSLLGDYNSTYLGIQECRYYIESNAMGLNCEIVYTVSSSEGLIYNVVNYLAIKNNNGKFEIIQFY